MQKVKKDHYWELAVFCMDYHSGQGSRGYRLLCKLDPRNFREETCASLRETEIYYYLEKNYAKNAESKAKKIYH